jgi:hypothetical protein
MNSAVRSTVVAATVGTVAAFFNGIGQAALVVAVLIASMSKAIVTALSGGVYSMGPNKVALKASLEKNAVKQTSTHAALRGVLHTESEHRNGSNKDVTPPAEEALSAVVEHEVIDQATGEESLKMTETRRTVCCR